MPYPNRISKEEIVRTARSMVEAEGIDALSLGKLAKALGVKAPSLYRHVESKEVLLQEVNLLTLRGLFLALDEASKETLGNPIEEFVAIMLALRSYAHAHPNLYVLAMTSRPEEGRPNQEVLVQMVMPVQKLIAQICSEEQSLTALRGAFALAHGYVMLELHQQLQRGGDLRQDFEEACRTYLSGWVE